MSLIFCPDFEFSAIFIVTSFLGVFTSILPPNIIVFSGISTSLYRSSPSLSYSSLGAIFTVSIRSPRPPLPLPFMRSFSPLFMPFGIFILMFSPLKFIECSPPFTATSNGIVTFARESRSSSSSKPLKPPVCLKPLKPLLLENPLNPPPPKIFFKISSKFPIPELLAKSWKFCPPNIASPCLSYCTRFFSSLKISYAAFISLNLSSAPGSLLISG